MSAQQSLSYFRRIITPEVINFINTTSELTLFLPVDKAWDEINPYEKIYLESEFASDDLKRIFNMHAVAKKGVKWSDSFVPGLNRNSIQLLTSLQSPTNPIILQSQPSMEQPLKLSQLPRGLKSPEAISYTPTSTLPMVFSTSFPHYLYPKARWRLRQRSTFSPSTARLLYQCSIPSTLRTSFTARRSTPF